jgi:uncharacterized protein (DUF697 family)
MTRHEPIVISFILMLSGCGPEAVGPRALSGSSLDRVQPGTDVPPPADTPDAGAAPVATTDGADAGADAGSKRPKLPTPDAGALISDAGTLGATATADAGVADAATADADSTDAVTTNDAAAPPAPVDAAVETGSARPPSAGELAITEALINPAGADTGREWIEIASLAADALDLSELHVADATIDVAVPAGIIDAGKRLALGQSPDASKNGGVSVAAAYGSRLTLNNDGEQISICVGPCAGGVVIDRVVWKALGAAYDGHAAVFDRAAGTICPATQPFGTAGDFGTPGDPDQRCGAPDAGF